MKLIKKLTICIAITLMVTLLNGCSLFIQKVPIYGYNPIVINKSILNSESKPKPCSNPAYNDELKEYLAKDKYMYETYITYIKSLKDDITLMSLSLDKANLKINYIHDYLIFYNSLVFKKLI